MASDPLKEVLLKVVQERQQQINSLIPQLQASFDPIVRDELEKKISQLQSELNAAQEAINQPQQAPVAPQPQPVVVEETRVNPDPQLLGSEPVVAPKGPSKAGLEAQIRELQTQLLDAARAVESGGPTPNIQDVSHLKGIRDKLSLAMQQIGAADLLVDVGELPPKPTPSQLLEADNLIKRSMLEKRRGNNAAASDLLRKAAEVAPGSPAVLEGLGDDMMERGNAKPAAETYAKALRIQPGNASIERKYAMAVAKSKGAVTLEEAMQMNLGDSPLNASDAANARIAAILSFFIPGAGQVVMGDYVKGAVYFFSWLILLVWLSVAKDQWHDLVASIAGKKSSFNPLILVPIVGSLGIAIAAAFTCKPPRGPGATGGGKPKANHPAPPVDLPFE